MILAHNRGFRRLWLGDAISLLGDWFTYVAVGTLVVAADQGLVSVAIVLLGHSLPRAVFAPLAGRLADRIDRRTIVIVASLLRAVTVLAMIGAAWADALWAVQALLFVRMAFGAFIDPAATAMLPQLVATEQISRANAILGATWSVMFAVGVTVGGLVTAVVGPIASLAIDAVTFVLAAGVFATLPEARPRPPEQRRELAELDERASGWAIAWQRPEVLGAALGKLSAALANGGAWVLLHDRAGDQLLGTTAMSLGLLHAARALGTGLGPLLWIGRLRASEWGLRVSNGLTLVAVAAFALADGPALTLAAALLWGIGVGANWVTASTRMQVLTDNDQLGRVASVDLVAQSLAQCVGGLLGAWLADRWLDPSLAAWS
ncbi:MAG TPA: MFS transporter, partial [Enhygromyxa sp.]|nr:MFS transporter [Enhygromyxa sp.]